MGEQIQDGKKSRDKSGQTNFKGTHSADRHGHDKKKQIRE